MHDVASVSGDTWTTTTSGQLHLVASADRAVIHTETRTLASDREPWIVASTRRSSVQFCLRIAKNHLSSEFGAWRWWQRCRCGHSTANNGLVIAAKKKKDF